MNQGFFEDSDDDINVKLTENSESSWGEDINVKLDENS